jgi:hypothetical protein
MIEILLLTPRPVYLLEQSLGAAFNMPLCEGRPAARIHTFMLSTAADLASNLVLDLPPDVRKIVEAHFFDGESIFKIQRRYKLKRRDLESMIEAALGNMRTALRSRGVRAVRDVI